MKKNNEKILKPIFTEIKKMTIQELTYYLELGKHRGLGAEMKKLGCTSEEINYCYAIMRQVKYQRTRRIELTLHHKGKQKKYIFVDNNDDVPF